MQSEHLSNLHPGWVVGGWVIAVAVTSAIYLAGVGLGLAMAGAGAWVWVAVSMVGGFFLGGLFVGLRWAEAPILHGAAITFFSVLVWFLVAAFGGGEPTFGPTGTTLGLVLLQLAASAGGGWMGRRLTLGRPGGTA